MAVFKRWQDLTIQDDYMFHLSMRQKHLCKKLLERILRVRIREIRFIEDEKSIKFRYGSKGIRLDVYVEADGAVYDVEMQVLFPSVEELAKRTRYYQSMIDLEMLRSGCKYKLLKPSIIIFICPFDPYGEGRHIYTFRNLCVENSELVMGDATTKIFLNTMGTMNDAPADLKAFLDYVNGVVSNDEFVQELDREVQRIKLLEDEEASYMTYEMKLEESHEAGRAEGRAEGRDQATVDYLKSIMARLHIPVGEAMDMFGIPASERPKYAALL